MKTWAAMYGLIWLAFAEIMLILFLPFDETVNQAIHVPLAVAVLAFAFYIQRKVRRTPCPERIKKITRTTWSLAIFQAILGVALVIGTALSWGNLYATAISFLHVGNALAIITQASSSATAFDMWEEKEFQTPTTPVSTPGVSPPVGWENAFKIVRTASSVLAHFAPFQLVGARKRKHLGPRERATNGTALDSAREAG